MPDGGVEKTNIAQPKTAHPPYLFSSSVCDQSLHVEPAVSPPPACSSGDAYREVKIKFEFSKVRGKNLKLGFIPEGVVNQPFAFLGLSNQSHKCCGTLCPEKEIRLSIQQSTCPVKGIGEVKITASPNDIINVKGRSWEVSRGYIEKDRMPYMLGMSTTLDMDSDGKPDLVFWTMHQIGSEIVADGMPHYSIGFFVYLNRSTARWKCPATDERKNAEEMGAKP